MLTKDKKKLIFIVLAVLVIVCVCVTVKWKGSSGDGPAIYSAMPDVDGTYKIYSCDLTGKIRPSFIAVKRRLKFADNMEINCFSA